MTESADAGQVRTYPMTYEQEAIWLDEFFDDGPSKYLESWVYLLSGPVDLDAAEWAIARVVDRHEALRSRLIAQQGQLVQIVRPEHDTRLARRPCAADDLDDELRQTVSEPMDLGSSPLRGTALQLAPDKTALAIQLHHAVVDDWALAILDEEFSELYNARVLGRPIELAPPRLQLGEYALAQRAAGIEASVARYWRDRLDSTVARTFVPADLPRPAARSHRGGQVRFRIGGDAGQHLRRAARALRTTPFTIFAATAAALLAWYSGSCEPVVGVPISRRGSADTDGLVGCLTNLLPLRLPAHAGQPFTDLLASARTVVLQALAHKDVRLVELCAWAGVRVGHDMAPICQLAVVVDDAPRVRLDLPGVSAERLYVHSGMAKFELCLNLVIDGTGYRGYLDYAADIYQPQTAERIARDFQALLAAAIAEPGRSLSQICRSALRSG